MERLISHYQWLYALGQEDRPILEAIEISGHGFDPNEPRKGNYQAYIAFSSYSKSLPPWLDRFGTDIKVVLSDRLREDPRKTMAECFDFLDIGSIGNLSTVESNQTSGITRTVSVSSVVRKAIPPRFHSTLRRSSVASKGARLAERWSMKATKRPAPAISKEDRLEISSILGAETEFYLSMDEFP